MGEVERDILQRRVVIGQGGIALNWKRIGLDQILERDTLLWSWWDTGPSCPEKFWMPHQGHVKWGFVQTGPVGPISVHGMELEIDDL